MIAPEAQRQVQDFLVSRNGSETSVTIACRVRSLHSTVGGLIIVLSTPLCLQPIPHAWLFPNTIRTCVNRVVASSTDTIIQANRRRRFVFPPKDRGA